MCHFQTYWTTNYLYFEELPEVLEDLKEMEHDSLLIHSAGKLAITEKCQPFVRNVCMPFDLHLKRKRPETQLFSMTV